MQPFNRSPFLVALFHPASLSMLALTLASGLCAAWWMAPVGLIFWVIVFLGIYRDPALQLTNTVAGRATMVYRYQAKFDRVQKTQTSLFRSLDSAPSRAKKWFKSLQPAVDELVEQTYRQCLHFANMDNFIMVSSVNKNLGKEIEDLKTKLSTIEDDHIRREYAEALVSLQNQEDNLQQMSNLLERFEAQLTSVTSTLESVHVEAVRMQSMDEDILRTEIPVLVKRIKDQTFELKNFAPDR